MLVWRWPSWVQNWTEFVRTRALICKWRDRQEELLRSLTAQRQLCLWALARAESREGPRRVGVLHDTLALDLDIAAMATESTVSEIVKRGKSEDGDKQAAEAS